eukprot:6449842-Amphidinium_carterae.1
MIAAVLQGHVSSRHAGVWVRIAEPQVSITQTRLVRLREFADDARKVGHEEAFDFTAPSTACNVGRLVRALQDGNRMIETCCASALV